MRHASYNFLLIVILMFTGIKTAQAQEVDGIYYEWTVFYTSNPYEEKKCYIASYPKQSVGSHHQRQDPYLLITYFKEQDVEEVSVYCGYEYKINGKIHMAIDDHYFRLFTKGDLAWAETQEDDKAIIQSMLNAKVIKIRGESAVGAYSVDEYSTKGLVQAYNRMRLLCNQGAGKR